MKRYIRSATREKDLDNVISWNGYFYGIKRTKRGEKYYKCKSPRFDDSFGGTEEVSADEYQTVAEKYAKMFR